MADTIRTITDLLANIFQDGQAASAITEQDMRDLIVSMTPQGGWADYNDLATATTPINHTGGGTTYLTNDEAGAFTNKNWANPSITDVWDAAGGVFDWTELAIGDTVDIRVDLDITTTAVNQEIDVDLEMASGHANQFDTHFGRGAYKAAGTYKVSQLNSIYMGDASILAEPAKFKFTSANNATIKVNGWYCRVGKR